ncbi:bacteriohemerythrin [Lacisediminimonas profundi]|uniref:bacteriohemerythrin n=1 Tax=Lacisediminimonas profundi TaxID=2603856 RepID=UPI00124B9688|nr:hemerythrin family protein [Lacisediminimonas profundi]
MLQEMWSNGFSTGASWLDELHFGIAKSLRRASGAPDPDFGRAYNDLLADLEMVFREEEEKMADSDPVAARSHREQHAQVLHGLHCAHGQVLDGDLHLGRQIATELLPRWLSFHMATMDVPLFRRSSDSSISESASATSACPSTS